MYKVIGGDGREYGPVSAEELRQWIGQGRLNAQSWIKPEGAANWQPLGAFAEFADALRSREQPPIASTGAPVHPTNLAAWKADVLARHAHLRIGYCLSSSWRLLVANFSLIAGAVSLYWLIRTVLESIPFVGVIYWVFDGVFLGGLSLVYLRRIRGQTSSVGDLFSGFRSNLVQLLLTGVVSGLLIFVAATPCCLILPGLYLWVAWSLAIPLVADKRLEFWTAMELSRKIVTRVWFEFFAVLVIPLLPWLIAEGLKSYNVFSAIFTALLQSGNSGVPDFRELRRLILQVSQIQLPFWIAGKVLLLLTLPFAIGARMVAYEALFGSRPAPTP